MAPMPALGHRHPPGEPPSEQRLDAARHRPRRLADAQQAQLPKPPQVDLQGAAVGGHGKDVSTQAEPLGDHRLRIDAPHPRR